MPGFFYPPENRPPNDPGGQNDTDTAWAFPFGTGQRQIRTVFQNDIREDSSTGMGLDQEYR